MQLSPLSNAILSEIIIGNELDFRICDKHLQWKWCTLAGDVLSHITYKVSSKWPYGGDSSPTAPTMRLIFISYVIDNMRHMTVPWYTSHEDHGVSNYRQPNCLFISLFWEITRKALNGYITGGLRGESTGDRRGFAYQDTIKIDPMWQVSKNKWNIIPQKIWRPR